jgi:hypothetical protein
LAETGARERVDLCVCMCVRMRVSAWVGGWMDG